MIISNYFIFWTHMRVSKRLEDNFVTIIYGVVNLFIYFLFHGYFGVVLFTFNFLNFFHIQLTIKFILFYPIFETSFFWKRTSNEFIYCKIFSIVKLFWWNYYLNMFNFILFSLFGNFLLLFNLTSIQIFFVWFSMVLIELIGSKWIK